jgi:RNA polymerase-binding transcription factor DksA
MATKKKAAKPAKKTIAPKKPARPLGGAAKPAAKKVVAKQEVKPAAKKAVKAPVEKKAPVKPQPLTNHQVAAKAHAKPTTATTTSAAKPVAKPVEIKEVKKAVEAPVKVEKPEVKVEVKKPEPVIPPPPPKKTEPPKPVKVVIPEIKTKTSRRYEPEFTKSVLDQPENIQTGPTMRYSDAELSEFKELILKKAEQAKKELSYLQGLITRKDEMGGDENENRYMTMEDGSMSMEREQLAQMASRQINYIDHLEKALMRIENKTYGICRVTGKLIDKARLRAVPHATLSIEAKQMMNK